jgi:hypothetical protein
MTPIAVRLGILVLGTLLAAGGVPPAAALVNPAATPGGVTVTVDEAGRLSLHTDRELPLADLVREIGAAIEAAVTVRRDPGPIGPLAEDAQAPDELLTRLAGRHSLALRYDGGRIVEIILVAWRSAPGDGEEGASIAATAPTAAPPPRPGRVPAPRRTEESERAAAVRDVIKLSYRKDEAATAELGRLVTTSSDAAVRGAAASALLGSARASPELVSRALTDQHPDVRLRAAQGLWVAEGASATARLRALAGSDPAPEVRAAITELLASRAAEPAGDPTGPHPEPATH